MDPSCNHLFATNAVATIEALGKQRGSLKSLTYETTDIYYQHQHLFRRHHGGDRSEVAGGLADFEALEDAKLVGCCPSFERALISVRSCAKLSPTDSAFQPTLVSRFTSTSALLLTEIYRDCLGLCLCSLGLCLCSVAEYVATVAIASRRRMRFSS